MTNLINKVKEAIKPSHHGDHSSSSHASTTYDSPQSSNHGPHDSNIINKTDPRVDSDRDHLTSTTSTTGHNSTMTGHDNTMAGHDNTMTGHHNTTTVPSSTMTGHETIPHSSTTTTHASPKENNSTFGDFGNFSNDINSRTANRSHDNTSSEFGQGRFDGDVHKASIGGYGVIEGVSGSKGPTTTKRFEMAQQTGSAGPGSSYNSRTTAGPHDSNLANKMDPRVDSDLDGSMTVGS
ncbi:hypothetical protein FE257_012842 [Aspergillus nanangensis]|uniref:Uncharacterized protein n=1 Tax=Aspergillus nanangensis TaxID=2582783 RepID=A0AAD4CFF0_ASPNN|nr:hypothetical protein FE257_012842 [Aspergillus nanangensis]